MLCKTVLCATPAGACTLVEVPFEWQRGDPIPHGALERRFATAVDALSALAEHGRQNNRVHVPRPPAKPALAPPGAPPSWSLDRGHGNP